MIAKAISYETDRPTAIKSLMKILKETIIAGTQNNKEFLVEVLSQQELLSKPMGTPWLGNNLSQIQGDLVAKIETLEKDYLTLTKTLVSMDSSSTKHTWKL